MLASILAVLALAQAPADTIPLPPFDSAYGTLDSVRLVGFDLPTQLEVNVRIDLFGVVDSVVLPASHNLREDHEGDLRRELASLRFLPSEGQPAWTTLDVPISGRLPSPPDFERSPESSAVTRRPEIENRREASKLLGDYYPGHLMRQSIGGKAIYWVFIDTEGEVKNSELKQTSGIRAIDEAIERLVWQLEFTPALNKGEPVAVWVQVPFSMSVPGEGTISGPEPLPDFIMGTRAHPLAEARIDDPYKTPPEVIQPEGAASQLSARFRELGFSAPLGLDLEIRVQQDGRIDRIRIREEDADSDIEETKLDSLLAAIQNLRLRPAREGSGNQADGSELEARFVFHPELGLIPAVPPGRCVGADTQLQARPTFAAPDKRPTLATPDWEQDRIIGEHWPLILQQGGQRFAMRFWLLIDERGRVCRSRFMKQIQTPWISSKARDIVTRLRFHPGMDEGSPVAVWHQYALFFEF